jgi:phenol 2-monooxygenase
MKKLSEYLVSANGPARKYTPGKADIDSLIEPILVLSGELSSTAQGQIPDVFWPVTGKWRMRGTYDLTPT